MSFTTKIRLKIYDLYIKNYVHPSMLLILFPSLFRAEFKKVFSGNIEYHKKGETSIKFLIRRNIHRLEKGINSLNRKSFFGADYICETCDVFLKNKKIFSNKEVNYIEEVLVSYFNIIKIDDSNSNLLRFKNIFSTNNNEISTSIWTNVNQDSYINLKLIVEHRRSARFFENKKISSDIKSEIFNLAFNIPSACNRLPFRVIMLEDDILRNNVLSYADGLQGDPEDILNSFVVVGDYSAYNSQADRHLIYIDSSYYIYLWHLTAFSKNIGSCILNYSENENYDNNLESLLNLKPWEKLINFVIYGEVSNYKVPISQKEVKISKL